MSDRVCVTPAQSLAFGMPLIVNYSKSWRQRLQQWRRHSLSRSDISPGAWIAASAVISRGVRIGKGSVIDEEAVLLSHDMETGIVRPVRIGTNSKIGARAIVMPGVSIGDGCSVAAGAVVDRDVANGIAVIGNPARERPSDSDL